MREAGLREETRYRVTGSLFLLAVAVICLPMLLDGAGLPARELPAMPMQSTLPEVQPLAYQVPDSDYAIRVRKLEGEVDKDGFLTDSGTRFGEPVLTPGTPAAGAADGLGTAGDGAAVANGAARGQGGATADGAATAKDDDSAATDAGAAADAAWAVQVASFARAANAEDFRTRLRRDGYEAFISTAKVRGQVLSRVAVGPLLDRDRAETLRGELAARYDVHARLMAFSN